MIENDTGKQEVLVVEGSNPSVPMKSMSYEQTPLNKNSRVHLAENDLIKNINKRGY